MFQIDLQVFKNILQKAKFFHQPIYIPGFHRYFLIYANKSPLKDREENWLMKRIGNVLASMKKKNIQTITKLNNFYKLPRDMNSFLPSTGSW